VLQSDVERRPKGPVRRLLPEPETLLAVVPIFASLGPSAHSAAILIEPCMASPLSSAILTKENRERSWPRSVQS